MTSCLIDVALHTLETRKTTANTYTRNIHTPKKREKEIVYLYNYKVNSDTLNAFIALMPNIFPMPDNDDEHTEINDHIQIDI